MDKLRALSSACLILLRISALVVAGPTAAPKPGPAGRAPPPPLPHTPNIRIIINTIQLPPPYASPPPSPPPPSGLSCYNARLTTPVVGSNSYALKQNGTSSAPLATCAGEDLSKWGRQEAQRAHVQRCKCPKLRTSGSDMHGSNRMSSRRHACVSGLQIQKRRAIRAHT